MKEKGLVQIYTGNGKGKSTAAFGLVLRAIGAGKKVFVAQFVKGQKYSEILAFEKYLPFIEVEQYGKGCFIFKEAQEEDRIAARIGLKRVEQILNSGEYDLVIMDEANIAVHYSLFTAEELIDVINNRAYITEVVITGRYAKDELLACADLITEMKEVKHYYNKGVDARKGIES